MMSYIANTADTAGNDITECGTGDSYDSNYYGYTIASYPEPEEEIVEIITIKQWLESLLKRRNYRKIPFNKITISYSKYKRRLMPDSKVLYIKRKRNVA